MAYLAVKQKNHDSNTDLDPHHQRTAQVRQTSLAKKETERNNNSANATTNRNTPITTKMTHSLPTPSSRVARTFARCPPNRKISDLGFCICMFASLLPIAKEGGRQRADNVACAKQYCLSCVRDGGKWVQRNSRTLRLEFFYVKKKTSNTEDDPSPRAEGDERHHEGRRPREVHGQPRQR